MRRPILIAALRLVPYLVGLFIIARTPSPRPAAARASADVVVEPLTGRTSGWLRPAMLAVALGGIVLELVSAAARRR